MRKVANRQTNRQKNSDDYMTSLADVTDDCDCKTVHTDLYLEYHALSVKAYML